MITYSIPQKCRIVKRKNQKFYKFIIKNLSFAAPCDFCTKSTKIKLDFLHVFFEKIVKTLAFLLKTMYNSIKVGQKGAKCIKVVK